MTAGATFVPSWYFTDDPMRRFSLLRFPDAFASVLDSATTTASSGSGGGGFSSSSSGSFSGGGSGGGGGRGW